MTVKFQKEMVQNQEAHNRRLQKAETQEVVLTCKAKAGQWAAQQALLVLQQKEM